MSDASEKLARTRLAILEHVARRERRHDPHDETPWHGDDGPPADEPAPPGASWLDHAKHAVRAWWRYHPAHMAVDLASPMVHSYARRKPAQLLAISALAGAGLMMARPWRLISLTTIVVAVLKSPQLSSALLGALSAADYRKDNDRP